MPHFLPIAVRYDGTAPAGGHGYQVHVGPMIRRPWHLEVASTDPRKHQALRFNYLSTDGPAAASVEALPHPQDPLEQPHNAREFDGGEPPAPDVQSARSEILRWVGHDAETALHPCDRRHGHRALAVVGHAHECACA